MSILQKQFQEYYFYQFFIQLNLFHLIQCCMINLYAVISTFTDMNIQIPQKIKSETYNIVHVLHTDGILAICGI